MRDYAKAYSSSNHSTRSTKPTRYRAIYLIALILLISLFVWHQWLQTPHSQLIRHTLSLISTNTQRPSLPAPQATQPSPIAVRSMPTFHFYSQPNSASPP